MEDAIAMIGVELQEYACLRDIAQEPNGSTREYPFAVWL